MWDDERLGDFARWREEDKHTDSIFASLGEGAHASGSCRGSGETDHIVRERRSDLRLGQGVCGTNQALDNSRGETQQNLKLRIAAHIGSCRGLGRRHDNYHGFMVLRSHGKEKLVRRTCPCCEVPASCPACSQQTPPVPKSPPDTLLRLAYIATK